ncbi:MAG TPA: SAM-dependent methyltransferase [Myxococcales bacterium]|nr:SAM-dependent methyltransferase [Deltaproteobacteria bacterium]MBU50668.1 SAM-dependent methyltransferase [Deltaproteobacteria bacterium]HAA55336.1 SAM-dependent methyltransferase [Myxococcales bacterium]|tara:strand:+ start:1358 stop:2446 length:1089 start_codon:yes stop_codon:yes gene_type:complete
MHLSKQTLLGFLDGDDPDIYLRQTNHPSYLHSTEMAHLYVHAAMLVTCMEFLSEQLWLQNKDDRESGVTTSYHDFLAPLLEKEISSAYPLKDFLLESGPTQLKAIKKGTSTIAADVLGEMMCRSRGEQKTFLIKALEEMSVHFLYEEELQEGRLQSLGHLGPCLYRCFDDLDKVFELTYQLDRDMEREHFPKERLYQGSGVFVQSGYSTILLALQHLDLKDGSKVVDLGSGYGRVGLVCALLYPEVDFVGYEYVPHRVDVSNRAAQFLKLDKELHFLTQDLSLASFKVPDADVYYLYDPFTKETYEYVLEQLVEVSKRQQVTIVTKGNARNWLLDIAEDNDWPAPTFFDEGNLSVFTSAPSV